MLHPLTPATGTSYRARSLDLTTTSKFFAVPSAKIRRRNRRSPTGAGRRIKDGEWRSAAPVHRRGSAGWNPERAGRLCGLDQTRVQRLLPLSKGRADSLDCLRCISGQGFESEGRELPSEVRCRLPFDGADLLSRTGEPVLVDCRGCVCCRLLDGLDRPGVS